MNNNTGLRIEPRATDYHMDDGHINLLGMPLFPSGSSLADFVFFEPQLLTTGDTNGCVIFTGEQIINALWEAWTQAGTISDKTNAWAESLGFMDVGLDGKKHFHCSERYLQIKTGNGLNGNNIPDIFDAARKYGLIPASILPVDKAMTPQQYINPSAITPAMDNIGFQFLIGVGGKNFLTYQWVNNGTANIQKRITALPYGPLAIGVNVGSDWNQVSPPAPSLGASPGHCIALFAEAILGQNDEADIYDHYLPNPKKLVNWDIRYALQAFLVVSPAPVIPPPPVNPTPVAVSNWLTFVKNWLLWLSNSLKAKAIPENIKVAPEEIDGIINSIPMSLTQTGNYVALISFVLGLLHVNIGSDVISQAVEAIVTLVGIGISLYGRYRIGDLTVLGTRKPQS